MRTIKQINAEIKTLKAELKTVRNHELALKAQKAIAYIEDQGYKWNGSGWSRSIAVGDKPLEKPRQFIVYLDKFYLVESIGEEFVSARRIISANLSGFIVTQAVRILKDQCRFVNEEIALRMLS